MKLLSYKDFELLNERYNTLSELLQDYNVFVKTDNRSISLHEALMSINEETYKDLKDTSKEVDPERQRRSRNIEGNYLGIAGNEIIEFNVTAENPELNQRRGKPTSYRVNVSLKDFTEIKEEDNTPREIISKALKGNVAVSCNCPAAMYWGQQYNGTLNDYSLDTNDIAPTINIPTQPICKHTFVALSILPFWRNRIFRDMKELGII
jgi:hypothetical protein